MVWMEEADPNIHGNPFEYKDKNDDGEHHPLGVVPSCREEKGGTVWHAASPL